MKKKQRHIDPDIIDEFYHGRKKVNLNDVNQWIGKHTNMTMASLFWFV